MLSGRLVPSVTQQQHTQPKLETAAPDTAAHKTALLTRQMQLLLLQQQQEQARCYPAKTHHDTADQKACRQPTQPTRTGAVNAVTTCTPRAIGNSSLPCSTCRNVTFSTLAQQSR